MMRDLLMCVRTAAFTAALAVPLPAAAQDSAWTLYRNERFGYRLLYPSDVFQPAAAADTDQESGAPDAERDPDGLGEGDDREAENQNDDPEAGNENSESEISDLNEDGRTFLSPDGQAKLVVFAAFNSENFTPQEYRETIVKEFTGYDRITYGPKGQTWFVLSGFRGNDIYYQKVMFSCRGNIINALSVTFPAEEKPRYAPIIERIEDNFRTMSSSGCDEMEIAGN